MSVIFSAWTVANIPDMNARALTTGTLFAIGSSTGLISSNIFVTSQAPRYMTALIINGTFSGVGCILTVLYSLYLKRLNNILDCTTRTTGGHHEGSVEGGGGEGEELRTSGSDFRFQT